MDDDESLDPDYDEEGEESAGGEDDPIVEVED